MEWTVKFHDEFEREFDVLNNEVQDELLAQAKRLEYFGPSLGRPHVDTLNGSRYANMKEMRFKVSHGVWRVVFAFDPKREAILLVSGNKVGGSQKRFYKKLIEKADERYAMHLLSLEKRGNDNGQYVKKEDRKVTV